MIVDIILAVCIVMNLISAVVCVIEAKKCKKIKEIGDYKKW